MRVADEIARTINAEDSRAVAEACNAVVASVGPKRRADVEDELIAVLEEVEGDVTGVERGHLVERGFARLIEIAIQQSGAGNRD
jgi:hypothetical protein